MLNALKSLAFKRWRLLLIPAIAALAFLMGRGCRPEPEVRLVEKSHVEAKSHVEETAAAKAETATVKQEQAAQIIYRTIRAECPGGGGSVVTDEVIQSGSAATTRTEAKLEARAESEASRELEAESTRELVVSPSRPDWRVSALVGTQVSIMPLALSPPVYGAHVERRILGPFSVGVWGLTSGTFGLSVSGEF